MADTNKMNQVYDAFMSGGIDRRAFEGVVFQHILAHHRGYGAFEKNEEDNSDFLSDMYPRLSRALARYLPRPGISFDAYLRKIIRLAYKEYSIRSRRRRETEYCYWDARAREEAGENEDASGEETPLRCNRLYPKQIVMVLLKSYYAVSDDLVARVASLTGFAKESLTAMLDTLRSRRSGQDARFHDLRERCEAQYFRCVSYERRLVSTEKTSERYRRLQEMAARHKLRLARMRLRLRSMRLEATNREVAAVMGIPKGSVDSGLFAFRRKHCPRQAPLPD